VCVCSLRYPACKAHAPYCHLWSLRLYHIFPRYLINDNFLWGKGAGGGEVTGHKLCVLIFCTTFGWIISRSKTNSTRFDQNRISVFVYSTSPSLHFNETWILWTDFRKILISDFMKLHLKIQPVGAELFRADRRTGMTKLIVVFRNLLK